MAEHLFTYINPVSTRDMVKVCRLLEDDGVIAYPTDVNWAFGCGAANVKALDRIRRLKPTHPKERPFSLLCSSISMAAEIAVIDSYMYRIFKKILPGPYTLILRAHKSLARQIKDNRKTVGIRIPNSPLVLAMVEAFHKPIATASVPEMAPGQPFQMGYQVNEEYGHGIDMVLDLGGEVPGDESTVIDFTGNSPVVVRQGAGVVDFL